MTRSWSKCNFVIDPPEKSVFELLTNLKFSFSESGPGNVHIPPKPIFLLKFSNFYGYTENAPNHILSSNSVGKILKMAIKSETGCAAEIFGIFCSHWDYQMVNVSRILKFLTWHGFDEFGWNDPGDPI